MVLGTLLIGAGAVRGAPPQLYHQPFNESVVRADPDDLLMIAGDGLAADDEVIYSALTGGMEDRDPPHDVPTIPEERAGIAPIVSRATVPFGLTIRLPSVMRAGRVYGLRIRTTAGEWSDQLRINDARPLWLSPSFIYSSGALASMPRELKVIGRNLQPAPGSSTRVRLLGPCTIELTAMRAPTASSADRPVERYVARVALPAFLAPGRYRVQLNRDDRSWVELADQTLEVRKSAPRQPRFRVDEPRFGGCRPNDDLDDSACISKAIAAASDAGGGIIEFPAGKWDLVRIPPQPGVISAEGIRVPDRVSLRGAGRDLTRIQRHREWGGPEGAAAFTLIGHTEVSGFTFADLARYSPRDEAGPFLRLGRDWAQVAVTVDQDRATAAVDEVVITRNRFDKTFVGIEDGGLPLHRLFITRNEFGAYLEAIRMTGNRFNMVYPFRIDESVIDNNSFEPGSMVDLAKKVGSMGSELGASFRVDFSGNLADGSSTRFLYDRGDARGWAAAFFWNMNNNVEEVLVSQNSASCTGDKIGDGPAISFDNNANTFALQALAPVSHATTSTVEIAEPLMPRQNLRDINLTTYYAQHWIQVASGPGLGQVRKIRGYTIDSGSGRTVFQVSPAWDVLPVSGQSRVAVGREYWQVYAVGNEIDHRQPLCQKSNRSRHDGGGIGLWAQSADSVIEGNRQYDTDGILIQQNYAPAEHTCPDCTMASFLQYFLEIRDNTVDGEYDWNLDCSASGIALGIAAAPWHDSTPPTVGYGNSVSHNRIRHADAERGGAIAQLASWYSGPTPYRWPLEDNLLIHHNAIERLNGPPARALCGKGTPRVGISFPDKATSWRTVLYANKCIDVAKPVDDHGAGTVLLCPSSGSTCECPSPDYQ